MTGPRAGALVVAGLLIGIAAQSLIQDGFGLERWQTFEAAHWSPAERTVPEAIGILILAVVIAARSGRPKVHRAGSWGPRYCPSCGASIPTASPEIAGNLFMVMCPRGCGTCNVIGPRQERTAERAPDVLHEDNCDGDCGGCRVADAARRPN